MNRDDVIKKLRAHEPELRAEGVASLAVFGSIARGDDKGDSDVDVVVRLTDDPRRGGFAYFGQIDKLSRRLEAILGRAVDVVAEPVQKERLRRAIEKERIVAF
jgi:predicted nucleotidyltransferase